MSDLSIDPLTHHLRRLMPVPKSYPMVGNGYGTPSQRHHVLSWNDLRGIRVEATRSGLLTWDESKALKHALIIWPWLSAERRKHVNSVVTMLFYIRRHFGFRGFDRQRLRDCPAFQLKPKRPPRPRQAWRKSRAYAIRTGASFVLI